MKSSVILRPILIKLLLVLTEPFNVTKLVMKTGEAHLWPFELTLFRFGHSGHDYDIIDECMSNK